MKHGFWALLPVGFFAAITLLFAYGLAGDPAKLPSTLINKPAPAFSMSALGGAGVPGLSNRDLLTGQVTVVNIFASWCVPCRDEHPQLMELKRLGVAVMGINYKDSPENALNFLTTLGNPYTRIGTDSVGRAAVDWGVYGVPETFIVDGKGIIRRKFVGPITASSLENELLPAITAAAN